MPLYEMAVVMKLDVGASGLQNSEVYERKIQKEREKLELEVFHFQTFHFR